MRRSHRKKRLIHELNILSNTYYEMRSLNTIFHKSSLSLTQLKLSMKPSHGEITSK